MRIPSTPIGRGLVFLALSAATALPARAGQPEYKITSEALQALDPHMQREVASLQYLMNAYQLRQFFALPSDTAQKAWIARFWAMNDPTPATAKNEMKIEHYIRVDIARTEFQIPEFPEWDKKAAV